MNIFEYFDKSGDWFTVIGDKTYFTRIDGTVLIRPHDGSYWRTICPGWYNKPEITLESEKPHLNFALGYLGHMAMESLTSGNVNCALVTEWEYLASIK